MYYQGYPGFMSYNQGFNCVQPCCNTGRNSYGYALILVLFILLVIIGAARF